MADDENGLASIIFRVMAYRKKLADVVSDVLVGWAVDQVMDGVECFLAVFASERRIVVSICPGTESAELYIQESVVDLIVGYGSFKIPEFCVRFFWRVFWDVILIYFRDSV